MQSFMLNLSTKNNVRMLHDSCTSRMVKRSRVSVDDLRYSIMIAGKIAIDKIFLSRSQRDAWLNPGFNLILPVASLQKDEAYCGSLAKIHHRYVEVRAQTSQKSPLPPDADSHAWPAVSERAN